MSDHGWEGALHDHRKTSIMYDRERDIDGENLIGMDNDACEESMQMEMEGTSLHLPCDILRLHERRYDQLST